MGPCRYRYNDDGRDDLSPTSGPILPPLHRRRRRERSEGVLSPNRKYEPTIDGSLEEEARFLLASGFIASALAFCEAKLTRSDPEACHEIVNDSKHRRPPVQRHPDGLDDAIERHADDQGDIQPVHMFIPIGSGDG